VSTISDGVKERGRLRCGYVYRSPASRVVTIKKKRGNHLQLTRERGKRGNASICFATLLRVHMGKGGGGKEDLLIPHLTEKNE